MKGIEHILEVALEALRETTGLEITSSNLVNDDAIISVEDRKFIAEVKRQVTPANKGVVLSTIKESVPRFNYPMLLVADYLPQAIAEELCRQGINYMDTSGNCSIRAGGLVLSVQGKRAGKAKKEHQSRAFQEAGIKIIYHLLNDPEVINKTFRDIARIAGVSLGSVASVLQELGDLKFYLKTQNGKFLNNKTELLKRWVIAYHEVLRPRLLLKRMRFTKIHQSDWETVPIRDAEDTVLWGGEPGAALLTNYIYPGNFTIYTNGFWKSLVSDLQLAPSENGEIEVLRMFWEQEDGYFEKQIVSPLLIYADLLGSGNSRNIETAQIILEHELSHLQ